MSKRILVAVDLSDASIEVLRAGRALATSRGAALAVVYVAANFSDVQPFFPQNYGANLTNALQIEQIARAAFEKRIAEVEGCAEIEAFFERGSAYAEIVRRAETWAADLVLVGSHGHTALERALLGSVASKVARHAHCAVMVVRSHRGRGVVLAATDLSDPSLPAVARGVEEARLRGSKLLIAHALGAGLADYGADAAAFFGSSALPRTPDARQQAHEILGGLLRRAAEQLGGAAEPLVLEGSPVASIVRAVEEHGADLLVVGTHGRTGLARLLMGSVAERLMEQAPCSVLVVRQAD
jgi:nucleotide-binding universal stress UspA family protein